MKHLSKQLLTVKANRPLLWFIPGPSRVIQASHIVFCHVLVRLKIEVLITADIADITTKLYWISVPVQSKQGLGRRVGGVEAGHPVAGVQGVHQGPAGVPVARHPAAIVVPPSFTIQKLSRLSTLVPKSGPVCSKLHLFLCFSCLPFDNSVSS